MCSILPSLYQIILPCRSQQGHYFKHELFITCGVGPQSRTEGKVLSSRFLTFIIMSSSTVTCLFSKYHISYEHRRSIETSNGMTPICQHKVTSYDHSFSIHLNHVEINNYLHSFIPCILESFGEASLQRNLFLRTSSFKRELSREF